MSELGYERALREWVHRRSMRWGRTSYAVADRGTTVAYCLSPAAPPRGVVMLVHGAGNDALFSFPGTIKRLLTRGFEVFAFDLDGHGRSSTTALDPATLHEAVPRAADESGAAGRGLPLHVIGVSFGGALVLDAIARDPDRYASAVLIAAPLRIHLSAGSILNELGPGLFRAMWRERRHSGVWGAIPSFGPVKRGVYPLRLAVPPGEGPFGYVEVLNDALDRMHLRDAAGRVECPVLLVYGSRDRIVPAEQGELLAELVPGSRLLRLPRETHLTAPLAAACAAGLLEWVEGHGRVVGQ